MKLVSFNIQNFRSIIHSGWRSFAHDNITALIGQNESGKTSVLEALQSFYDKTIHDDVLRSDLSLPIVNCNFDLEKRSVADMLEASKIPEELRPLLKEQHSFKLTRKWKTDRSSVLFISTEEILSYYERKELERATIEEKTQEEVNRLLDIAEDTLRSMELSEKLREESQKSLTEKRKQLDHSRKVYNKAKKPDLKLIAEKDFKSAQTEYSAAEEDFNKKVEAYDLSKQKTQELSEKVTICKICNDAVIRVSESAEALENCKGRLKDTEHQYEISSREKDQRTIYSKLQQIKEELELAEKNHAMARENEVLQKMIAAKVLSGEKYTVAESEAKHTISKEKDLYTIYELGEILFRYIPIFEFFEDFSSLLPNKIDLEDILNENRNVEGYKAARNFLQIAGLNAAFFREKNHRILKQKIENLNGEITINFQDYWSQNVGKDNKIQLNFELEHYDYTHPEKSGKPYLEFWIKDKAERLYPKQRSRGVRWFLSFYLELKATAKQNNISRVLLIDEPGLSLHARAQEDVLKVFEDLKTAMQIVYCTHSPHLINVNKLYRILAVQRSNENDDTSETLVLDANELHSASSDTLSPVYSLMGVRVHSQDFIKAANNIIIEDTIAYYYLNLFCKLAECKQAPSIIPSTGLTNIPVLTNILLGWKVGFSVLMFGKSRSDEVIDELEKSIFYTQERELDKRIIRASEFEYPEDVLSTLDFKKFVLQKREGITEKNSEYVFENGLSRTILISQFINLCESKNIQFKDLDNTTQKNINLLISKFQT